VILEFRGSHLSVFLQVVNAFLVCHSLTHQPCEGWAWRTVVDQCHKAMKDISEGAKEVVGHAAKDAGKLVATASKAVKRKGTRVTGAM
jgi:hypothetical protein